MALFKTSLNSCIFAYILVGAFAFSALCKDNAPEIEIATIHGNLTVRNPLVIELINSPAMQRLKKISQYGPVDHVLKHKISYNRFDHSVGVFYILWKHGASQIEQIAGLLHDISHTAFSHATDHLFMGALTRGAYQDTIHEQFLENHGIGDILAKYGLSVSDVSPKNAHFRALEQPAPSLCADRIEYNIYSAYMDNLLPENDIQKIHADLHFDGHNWFFETIDSAKKFALIPLHEMLYMWGSPCIILVEQWLTKILQRALHLKMIAKEDIFFNCTDGELWQHLTSSSDLEIQQLIYKIMHYRKFFSWRQGHEHDAIALKTKFSGVDPLVKTSNRLVQLTIVHAEFREEYERIKNLMHTGWIVAIHHEPTFESDHVKHDPRLACKMVDELKERSTVQEGAHV